MKRFLDLLAVVLLMVPAVLLGTLLALLVKATSPGPAFFCTQRVGRNNQLFTMYKFRTMLIDTPQVATHLLENPDVFLTPIGGFLRRTSLDELPQLLNVLRGEMSLVGPRPALYNQHDLVHLRTQRGVHRLMPGITGWAQVNGRDELLLEAKADLDADYLAKRSLLFDIRILVRTAVQSISGRGVSH